MRKNGTAVGGGLDSAIGICDRAKLSDDMREILDYCSEGIYVADGRGIGLMANSALMQFYDFTEAELLGREISGLVKSGAISDSAALRVLGSRRKESVIQVNRHGKRLLNTGTPIFDGEGNLKKVVVTVRDVTELNRLMEELNQLKDEAVEYRRLDESNIPGAEYEGVVSASSAMKEVVKLAVRVATVDSVCLLLGESGSGKDVIARLMHESSNRREKPFVKINCGAIPANLMESEIFGYVHGAFTGAHAQGKEGMFEVADGGTLFLDEVGDMPLNLQVKLLQVIQDMSLRRLGGTKEIKVDVRIISATNRDLEKMIPEGLFREDLYYRINIVPIRIPPLRERPEDISALAELFLKNFNQKYNKNTSFSSDVRRCFLRYYWPGNVRELKNVVERIVVTEIGSVIGTDALPAAIREASAAQGVSGVPLKKSLQIFEKEILTNAIIRYKSLCKVGDILGVDPSTVFRKIKKYGIDVDFTYR
jgi:PAS domain S-box-containing protein